MAVRSSTLSSFPACIAAAAMMCATAVHAGPPARPADVQMNRNYQDVPLAPFPGVTVAHLKLQPGTYLMHAKLRYRGDPVGGEDYGGCAFEGVGIGSLDSSEHRIELIGWPGTADGVMMDYVVKNPGDDPDVHVQCFGNPTVHIINTQFVAILANITVQP